MASPPRRRAGFAAGLAALLLVVGLNQDFPAPEQEVESGAAQTGTADVHRTMGTWIPYWSTQTAYSSVLRNADLIEYASPFWYQATGATGLRGRPGAGNGQVVAGLRAAGIKVLPSVTLGMNGTKWAALMAKQANRTAHVNMLVRLTSRYDGLDLDYETFIRVANAAQARTVRDTFTAVVSALCARLHQLGKRCTITVMARTADAKRTWRGPNAAWVYDYPALLDVVDRLRIMAYHEHGAGSSPGPITSTGWVTRIARYAASSADDVGVPRSRIEIALPAYGFDWPAKGRGISRTSASMEKLRAAVHAPRRWDATAEEPTFTYVKAGVKHSVHYPNAVSTQRKLSAIRSFGVRYGLWCPVGEDPAVWSEAFRPASTW